MNKKNILIIDDNPLSVDRLLSDLDKDDNFKYTLAEYLRPAINELKTQNKEPFDLILLDQNMGSWKTPGEVVQAAKKLAPQLESYATSANRTGLLLLPWLMQAEITPLPKILIISQYGKSEIANVYAENYLKKEFCGFQNKPIDLKNIIDILGGE